MSREYTDERIDEVLAIIKAEFFRATRKHPAFNSSYEGFAVMKKQLDDAWEDIKCRDADGAARRSIKLAARGMRFFYDLVEPNKIHSIKTIYGLK